MSSLICFLDTETTGLSLDDDIWEFAAIRREIDGTETAHQFFIEHNRSKCDKLPDSFKADHKLRFDLNIAFTQKYAAYKIHEITDGAHIVGALPSFDAQRMEILLGSNRIKSGWHYHLINIEDIAIGWLAAKGIQVGIPWKSDAVSLLCGVEPPDKERHTAMGDVLWVRHWYDKIMEIG